MPPSPAWPRSGEKAHQERLGLVVGGVRERDARPAPPRQAQQEAEPLLARQLLHRGAPALGRGEGAPEAEVEAQPEAARGALRGGGVAVGREAAQPVVEVGDLDLDPEPAARGQQQVQQAGRVRAAGERGDHARPRREQPVPRRVRQERQKQRGQIYFRFPARLALRSQLEAGK